MMHALPAPSAQQTQQPYDLLSSAFSNFSDNVDKTPSLVREVEEKWQAQGLHGPNSLNILLQFKSHINWEAMTPDQFSRFYRFVFHVCKDPGRKHVQLDIAMGAWGLVLQGRFRLLDRWRQFLSTPGHSLRVVNEDQWRQLLDFSRTVHEDLSNFDPNGAWACILDEFVEWLRGQAGGRCQPMEADVLMLPGGEAPQLAMAAMPPRSGSKRRSPDIDTVTALLSNMPLSPGHGPDAAGAGAGAHRQQQQQQQHQQLQQQLQQQHHQQHQQHQQQLMGSASLAQAGSASKRMCLDHPQLPLQMLRPETVTFELPMLHLPQRRIIKTRRSGVSDLLNSTVADALGFGLGD